MAEDTRPFLADYLTRHYAGLKRRLTRLLGNSDLASDALQDTWLRLQSKSEADQEVKSPIGYVLRVAVNIAVDIQRRQSKSLSWEETQEIQELMDLSPGPAQTAEARSELAALAKYMNDIPRRQQDLFLLIHWEGLSQKEAAAWLGISERTVAYDLKRVHQAISEAMEREKP